MTQELDGSDLTDDELIELSFAYPNLHSLLTSDLSWPYLHVGAPMSNRFEPHRRLAREEFAQIFREYKKRGPRP
jgi:hypothetical protein